MDVDNLIRKLGLSLGQNAFTLHAPVGYTEFLHIPESASSVDELAHELDWIQAFYTTRAMLEVEIATLSHKLAKTGQLWLSWPKQSSGIATTLGEHVIREIVLTSGLVDVKIAAVNETWSGLKFVYRLRDR